MTTTHVTACILCSRNCGIEIDIDGDHIVKVRGDHAHPVSEGYLCQKAARLEHYQNNLDRLDKPLRRRADGSFEAVDWDTAISAIAAQLVRIREQHGGRAFAYYGGGGQGNHLGGVFGHALLPAMRSTYHYSALAQEKTGDFWVNGKLFGRQTCHTTEDIERSDFVVFIGTNPWQAHGIRNARDTVKELSKDPARTLVVIDPRRTETAALADIHLQLRPGTDAFLLAAIIAVLVREDLVDHDFIARRTSGYARVREAFGPLSVAELARRSDIAVADLERVARGLAAANSACIRVDLGIQQSLHSTLNSYLEKLLFLLTGNFGKPGGNNLHTFLLPLIGHSGEGDDNWRTLRTGIAGIGKLYPPNVLPKEIDNDDPRRVRALVVDSANPALSGADTLAYERALKKLELLVVIDVAMTETARLAHWVLPAASQFEKWEATFFNLEFPRNHFHLRAPVFPHFGDTLAEPEIYRRLLVAMGELPASFPLLRAVARLGHRPFAAALGLTLKLRPSLVPYAAFVLAQTLGETLPDGAKAAAPLWFAAHRYAARHAAAVRRAGVAGTGAALGEALFARILNGRHGSIISTHEYSDTWQMIRTGDRRVHLDIDEMLLQLGALSDEAHNDDYPLVLIAGERRAYNANTIFRDPAWRKNDPDGALRIHPHDAGELGVHDGDWVLCTSEGGELRVRAQVCDTLRPGVVTLPHGYGMRYGSAAPVGPAINRLTVSGRCDPITATPYHKYVPVRVLSVQGGPPGAPQSSAKYGT